MTDKSAARSITILAAVAFAVIQTLEGLGVVPVGTLEQLAVVGKGLAGLGAVYGLRRAISANGLIGLIEGIASDDEYADDEPDEDYELTDEDFEDEELEDVPEGQPYSGGY
jgi:hypothetical protein